MKQYLRSFEFCGHDIFSVDLVKHFATSAAVSEWMFRRRAEKKDKKERVLVHTTGLLPKMLANSNRHQHDELDKVFRHFLRDNLTNVDQHPSLVRNTATFLKQNHINKQQTASNEWRILRTFCVWSMYWRLRVHIL